MATKKAVRLKGVRAPLNPDGTEIQRVPNKYSQKKADGVLAEWWKAPDDKLAMQLCGTASYLKQNQDYRMRQLAVDVRMYCGLSVYSYAGSSVQAFDRTKTLPNDKPTFNLIQSATDTLVSRLCQAEPAPKFLTDGADYHQRHTAQELNRFTLGEFNQTKLYQKAPKVLRDAIVTGTGLAKVYRSDDDRVCIDRVMSADLFVDENDSLNGEPQQLIQLKLVDRAKLTARGLTASEREVIERTPKSYPDESAQGAQTVADQVMVVEGWKLASGDDPEAEGYACGRHTIATVSGVIFDEEWHKTRFPFACVKYSDPFLGYWGQGLATQLFGTQMSINRISYTISRAIKLVGVPRIFQEASSKVVSSHHNDQVGSIVKYTGTKPEYVVAPCNAPELYKERDAQIQYGFQQCGVSAMQATAQKPGGLDSGEAIRSYDDINSDRFALLSKKYDQFFIDVAYLVTDVAMDITKETGKYQTVYPNKDGTQEIDLPKMDLLKNPFIIQCFNESSLPRTPAGRMATVTEQVQSGMLTIKEGRRLLRVPDLEQNERLDNSSEERIFQVLDKIVESGKYTMPDTFMDLQLATELTVKYINLYLAAGLEEKKAELLRKFFRQTRTIITGAQPTAPQPAAAAPTGVPAPPPVSPILPNAPQSAVA